MTAVPLGETATLCILCPPGRERVTRPGGMTDWGCHDRLLEQLGEIVARFALLSARPGYGVAAGRRAPGFHSRPPVDLTALILRDPRTAPIDLGEPHSPLNLFLSWGGWLRRQRGQAQARYPAADLATLAAEGVYLTNALDWITRQLWVPTFAEQLRVVVAQLRSAGGEPNPRPVGTCKCGHSLFPPRPGEQTIRCGGCEAAYDPLEQIAMVKAQAGVCSACGHLSAQHSNDEQPRTCNMPWCPCPGFEETEQELR